MEKLNLYQKLSKIQEEVKGLGKDKDGQNYKYVTGSKVLDHIKPIMIEHGIILKQEILSIDNIRQDYLVGVNNSNPQGRPKSEILSKVMMRFTWIDCETGDKDENLFGANGQNDWDKGVGSALTYAERYFLLKYFHINTDEDDIDNPERKAEETEAEKLRIETEQKEIDRLTEVQSSLENAKTADDLKTIYTALAKPDQIKFKVMVTEFKAKLEEPVKLEKVS